MDIQTKDGILLRGIPDGTPEADIKARIAKIRSLGKEGVSQPAPTPFRSSAEKAVTPQEEVLGNPMVRGMIGAARPFVGAGQLIANTVGMGEPVNKAITETDRNIQRGREFIGSTGFDAFQAGGQMASPAYLGAAAAMPNAASTAGRIWQGTKFGAGAGAAEPVTGPNYWSEKGAQTVGGAATGAVIPAAWEGTKALGRAVRNVAQPYMGEWGANQATGRLAKNVAGDKADDIIDLLQRSTPTLPGSAPTAGQAAVPAGSAEFSALQKIAATRDPSKFYGIERAQEGARSQAIGDIAGDASTIAAAKTARSDATRPLREATFEATRPTGVSTDKLLRQIRGVESQPGIRASDVVSTTLGKVKEKIAEFSKDGFINAKDLYTIRKEIGNYIQQNADASKNWDKRLTGGLQRDLQRNIDDAIEAAGGSQWKQYLSTYAEKSKPIEQMQLAQGLQAKLDPALGVKQRASGYSEALRKAGTEGDLNVMTPPQVNTLQMVSGDLSRDASMNAMAKQGQAEALRRIGAQVPEVGPTGFFDPKISFMRGAVNRVSGQATDRILNQLGKKMDNPQEMARIMREAKPFERKAIVDALMRYQGVAPQVMDEGR